MAFPSPAWRNHARIRAGVSHRPPSRPSAATPLRGRQRWLEGKGWRRRRCRADDAVLAAEPARRLGLQAEALMFRLRPLPRPPERLIDLQLRTGPGRRPVRPQSYFSLATVQAQSTLEHGGGSHFGPNCSHASPSVEDQSGKIELPCRSRRGPRPAHGPPEPAPPFTLIGGAMRSSNSWDAQPARAGQGRSAAAA